MIFLQILKIIGIVLACIVGLVLLIVLLALIFPVTYRLSGCGKNTDISATASVRWLFGLITFRLDYAEKKAAYYIRAAGIKVMKGDLTAEKIAEGIDHLSDETSQVSHTPVEFEKSDYTGKKGLAKKKKQQEAAERKAEREAQKAEKRAEKEEKKKEREQDERSFSDKVSDFCEKLHEIWDKYQTAKYILTAPVTERAWKTVKQQLIGILGHIRPRSIRGNVTFGFEDPARTAEVYGLASSLSAMIDPKFMIVPDMDGQQFSLDAVIKGRIFLGFMVLSVLKIFTDRNVRRVYRYTRKNLFEKKN